MGDTMGLDLPDSTTSKNFTENALSAADRAFRLLVVGPSPLSVDGRFIGHGVPQRAIALDELKEMLLAPQAGDELKDDVWAHLIRRSRCDGPAWVIACVGMAMPGLKNLAARTSQGCPAHVVDDIVSEMVTNFVEQLRRIDLDRPNILPRLLMWARKGALRVRARELASIEVCAETPEQVSVAAEPFMVLAEAVRCRIISPDEAKLINATRLEGQPLRAYAARLGLPADRLYKRRRAAEARLARAIEEGQVSVSCDGLGSNLAG
ncbi:sigma-70 family RNA polymerase sigma factor [Nonomuraea sp. NN258]|uniref:sigma-70 family RNA polymerase sigma factor n=1 Tax=Nonomuraea antri TaxID=2730852 RepID=UPI0015690C76|nr:sigma-70 family RNA polymerase sigma factor [Nonomuraea antri]NRQ30658.1 sigma-70 family RNA polymerase sigma factor [Nonomuraea antri]